MVNLTARTARAAALHRQATATATAATVILDATRPAPADHRQQYDLAVRLRVAAEILAPGWAGADLEQLTGTTPVAPTGTVGLPPFIRIGTGRPFDDAAFPALVPLLGTGHLTVDADARDPRVAALLRAVLLRLLAAVPTGELLVRAVDGAGAEDVFAPFAPLADAGVLPPPATDLPGLQAVLAEAEQWVAPAGTGRPPRHDRTMLLVVAALPELTEPTELTRMVQLAEQGPAAGLHLIVAGWPPPPLIPELVQPPLPLATPVTLRNPYALLGNPPDASLGRTGGLNCPVFLDAGPEPTLIEAVCRTLAAQADARSRMGLADLLPAHVTGSDTHDGGSPADDGETADDGNGGAPSLLWTESAADGLTTTVGDADGRPVSLGFTDLTPHWLIGGRPGAGRTAFLTNVLLGLAARYGPAELAIHLVDLGTGEAFADHLQTERDRTWLPQVRSAGMQADREYLLALVDDLDQELTRRLAMVEAAGVTRYADLPAPGRPPRIVCVVENYSLLVAERDRLATNLAERLAALARRARNQGVHLVLTGTGPLEVGSGADPREGVLGQFPVRVALPGGSAVLAPANDAAAGLPLGTAVVNTAGGLGGPRGATRGHERMVRFPDPAAESELVAAVRRRLWAARPEDSTPPEVFAGYARPHLGNDPAYRSAVAGRGTVPTALIGRVVDVRRTSAGFAFDRRVGRHLALLGPSAGGMLVTAARTVAAHHEAGTARFVLAPLATGTERVAGVLAAELGERQQVTTVDATGLVEAFDADQPTYLVVFGAETLSTALRTGERFRTALREAPLAGTHLLGWWRSGMSGLVDVVSAGEVTGLVGVDLPATHVAPLFGSGVDWQPRVDRVLMRDVHEGRTRVLVPYAESRELP